MDAEKRAANYHTVFDLAWQANKSVKGFLCPDLEHARTRVGTSLSDYSLPYVINPEVNKVLEGAMAELAGLFICRNKEIMGENKSIDHEIASRLMPRTYKAPAGIKNQKLRRTLEAAPRHLFLLDSGIMESWLAANGRGRALLEKLSHLFVDAVDEMAETGGTEETPFFLLWTLLNSYVKASEKAKKISLSEETQEITAQALAIGLHLINDFVKDQILDAYAAQLPPHSRLVLCWPLLISPAFFLADNAPRLHTCRTYDVPAAILGEWEEKFVKKAGGLSSFSTFEQDLKKLLASKRKIRRAALRCYRTASYRHAVMDILEAGLPLESELFSVIESFFLTEGFMEKTLSSSKSRKELVAMTRDSAKEYREEEDLSKKLSDLALLFKYYSNWRPLRALRTSKRSAFKEIRINIAADLADNLMASYAREMMGDFIPQNSKKKNCKLDDLYSRGRLYRFGSKPILKQSKTTSQAGHYYIDLRNFVKQTGLLKKEEMTRSIREDLYEPLLSIAGEKIGETSQFEHSQGISLNYLQENALSISGDIAGIVEMALKIRQHLEHYTSLLQENEKTFKKTVETELVPVSQPPLLSGSFITYGAPARVIDFDDTLWGAQKVSLSEKINESAKGTLRTESVYLLARERLHLERKRLNLPHLALPFQVYVGNSLALPLDPRYEVAIRKAFASGKARQAYKLYVQAARMHVKKTLSTGIEGIRHFLNKGMALYNAGDALSGEALAAYRQACARNFRFADLKLTTASLDPEIRSNFAFFHPILNLVVAMDDNKQIRQIFHFAGAAALMDFEDALPTEIWEMIDMEGRFGRMLGMSQVLADAIK